MLHTILFLAVFVSLGLWLITKDNKWGGKPWGRLAGLSMLAYFFSYIFGAFYLTDLIIDLALFAGATFLVNIFTGRYIIALPLLVCLSGSYYYWQQHKIAAAGEPLHLLLKSTAARADGNTIIPSDLDEQGEVFVVLKKGYTIQSLELITNRYELTYQLAFVMKSPDGTDLDDVYALNIPEGKIRMLPALLQALDKHAAVASWEVNEVLTLTPLTANRYAADKSANPICNDPEINKMWAYTALEYEAFYKYLTDNKIRPRKKVRIAIIDTGIDSTHEDLQGHFVASRPDYGIDPHGHGTHCAGIAAAVSNNQKGIASLAFSNEFVEVVSIRVFDEYGRTSQKRIIDGMLEAADMGCTVISMSLGGPINTETQFIYAQAIEYAQKRGAIVVVAAGNENMDAAERAPAGVKGVITVAALDQKLQKADFSNDVSKLTMAVSAPCVDIFSTMPEQSYNYMSGTSMATPYVAGLVAILKSVRPNLTTAQVFDILQKSGTDTPQSKATGKCIQPLKALKLALNN
jgi:thermitase